MAIGDTDHARALAGQINRLIVDIWVASERNGPRFDEFDLTGQQHAVLARIVAEPDITARELARAMGVSKGAISQHLARLEQGAYISRQRSPHDGRVSLFELGKRGQAYQRIARRYEQYLLDSYTATLSESDMEDVVRALEKLRSVFGSGSEAPDGDTPPMR